MTPEQAAYRDAWLAELWPVVHGADKARGMVPRGTCKSCGKPVDQTGKKGRPRQFCIRCRPAKRVAA